jgi:phosphatidate cytidylyltransferase
VSDWRDDEFRDDREDGGPDQWSRAPGREGVRVVGDPPPGDPAYGAYGSPPAQPPAHDPYGAPTNPAGRFPLPDDVAPPAPRQGGQDAQLPHWSEPPTGEVPAALGGSGGAGDDDFDSWSSLGGPRFRTGDSDWAEEDFGDLRRDDAPLGALGDDDQDDWAPPPSRRERRTRRGRGRGQQPVDEYAEPGHDVGMHDVGMHDEHYDEHYDDFGGDQPDEHQQGPENLVSRVATAGVVAGVALLAFALGRVTAMLLVAVIVGLCAFELYEAFRRAGYHTATVMGLLACVLAVPVAYDAGERGILMVAVLAVVFTFLWYLLEVVRARPTINIALTLLVFAWIGLFGAFAGLFLSNDPGGTGLLLGVAICAIGADVAAYFAGSTFGKTPLLPNVSPNKTVEGLVAGAIAAIVLGGIVGATLHPWADKGIGAGLALGLVVAITSPIGDLSESLIKRDLGLKDLGSFLPGHGGFLDRFDAILFTLPAAYYLAIEIFT